MLERVCAGSRERVHLAIKHCPTDRIPKGELCIDEAVIRSFLNCDQVGFDESLAFIDELGLDLICLAPFFTKKDCLPSAAEVGWPDLEKWLKTGLFTFAVLDGAFEWGVRLFGFQSFILLPRTSPKVLQEFVAEIERLNLELSKFLCEKGIDGIIVADDIAYQKGLMISPEELRRFFFPSLKRQVKYIARWGKPVFFHSDGDLRQVLPDLIDAGFQGLNCLEERSGMDILKVQSKYGNKLCLWGSLAVEDFEKMHNPLYFSQVASKIFSLASQLGFILGTTCGIFQGIDLQQLIRFYKYVDKGACKQ